MHTEPKKKLEECGAQQEQPASPQDIDHWSDHRKNNSMICANCLFFVNTRCRRHAPVAGYGYPMVYNIDWCGDMKPTKRSMGGH